MNINDITDTPTGQATPYQIQKMRASQKRHRITIAPSQDWRGVTAVRQPDCKCAICGGSNFTYRQDGSWLGQWSADGIRGYRCGGCEAIKPEPLFWEACELTGSPVHQGDCLASK